jgi:protease I
MNELKGKRIAIVATNGFELAELMEPKKALEAEGADVDVISQQKGEILSWNKNDWGDSVLVEKTLDEVVPQDYDALVLPGGVINADHLRTDKKAVEFVRQHLEANKPVAAICHAAWTLIETGMVRGHTLTSWPSLRTDLVNAGAEWVDQEVVLDQCWITSRKPEDLPAFNKVMLEIFSASVPEKLNRAQ